MTPSRTEWLKELWHYRELLYFLAWRDVTIRYKQAALGAAWAILQPVMGMIIFTLFFGRLAGIQSGDIPYPIFVYAGLGPWTYFATVLNTAGNSLIGNSNLVTKVYFPRVLLPGASAAAGLLDLAIRGACEAALAQRLGQLLDAGLLPEPALLEAEFAPREPSAPEVSVQLPALTSFDALLGGEVCA